VCVCVCVCVCVQAATLHSSLTELVFEAVSLGSDDCRLEVRLA